MRDQYRLQERLEARHDRAMRRRPYGIYVEADNQHVLFDRKYRPIARFEGDQTTPALLIEAAHRDRPIVLPLGKVTPLPPDLRINFRDQVWLYNDATSDRVNTATRKRIEALKNVLAELGLPDFEGGVR